MSKTSTLILCAGKITRAEVAKLPTPSSARATHVPIPHTVVVETQVETLSHRHIGGVNEEFAVSSGAMEMFGVLDLETSLEGMPICDWDPEREQQAIPAGLRNWAEIFVWHNLVFRDDYSPVLAKHSKHFSLEDALSIGVTGCNGTLT